MPERRKPTRRRAVPVLLALVTASAGFAAVTSVEPTQAVWTVSKDRAVTVTAATPAAPTNLRCSPTSGSAVGSMQFLWDAPAGPTPSGYTLTFNGGTAQTTAGTSFTVNAGLLALPSSYSIVVVSNYGSWSSPASSARTFTVTGIGVLSFSYTCT